MTIRSSNLINKEEKRKKTKFIQNKKHYGGGEWHNWHAQECFSWNERNCGTFRQRSGGIYTKEKKCHMAWWPKVISLILTKFWVNETDLHIWYAAVCFSPFTHHLRNEKKLVSTILSLSLYYISICKMNLKTILPLPTLV